MIKSKDVNKDVVCVLWSTTKRCGMWWQTKMCSVQLSCQFICHVYTNRYWIFTCFKYKTSKKKCSNAKRSQKGNWGSQRRSSSRPGPNVFQWPIRGEWQESGKAVPRHWRPPPPTTAQSQTWNHLRLQLPNCLDPCTLRQPKVEDETYISPSSWNCPCFFLSLLLLLAPPFSILLPATKLGHHPPTHFFTNALQSSGMQKIWPKKSRRKKKQQQHSPWTLNPKKKSTYLPSSCGHRLD